MRFIDEVTGGDDELQRYLQRLSGYCLTGVTTEQMFAFLHGTGANGKTVFLNTISAIMGDYATVAAPETFIASRNDRHPTDLAALRGARLVVSSEIEQGLQWNSEARIKSVTGGERIKARFMRQDEFEFTPQFKPLFAGNHKPALRGVGEAMRRRTHLVPFTVTIPPEQREPRLAENLKKEWRGILTWMIDGCLDWQEKEGLHPPQKVISATSDDSHSEDVVGRFIDEEIIEDPQEQIASSVLYRTWREWAEKRGECA